MRMYLYWCVSVGLALRVSHLKRITAMTASLVSSTPLHLNECNYPPPRASAHLDAKQIDTQYCRTAQPASGRAHCYCATPGATDPSRPRKCVSRRTTHLVMPSVKALAEPERELPSHYSPRTGPTGDIDMGEGQGETSGHAPPRRDMQDLSLPPGPSQPGAAAATTTTPHAPSESSPPPPPSLLSPAFTPPGTPGAATPNSTRPRGFPVDSAIPSGGCGTKKPRLLETLPEVRCTVRARIPTVSGTEMFLHLYENNVDHEEHLAIVFGNHVRSRSLDAPREGETEMDRMIRGAYTGRLYPGRTTSSDAAGQAPSQDSLQLLPGGPADPPLVRIHSQCYTGETAWSARCDCGEQLDEAARLMSLPGDQSGGIIIYLRQEGRGIGLGEKLKAYNLQDLGSDTVEANLLLRHPADARSYGLATSILLDLGQSEIRLLTNNPDKIRAVEGPNREVIVKERVPMVPLSWRGKGGFQSREVEGYLKTKVWGAPAPSIFCLVTRELIVAA